ncbi:MAG: DUF4199 domain-containing protein [Bacteroidetes bacterium]|nr:DUF4199 domain-containing protein [Bacteroidota bacterium]
MKSNYTIVLKNSAVFGSILGGFMFVTSLLIYVLNVNVFNVFFWVIYYGLILLAIPITLGLYATNYLRTRLLPENRMTYLEAFVGLMIIFFIALIISTAYSLLQTFVIDPNYLSNHYGDFTAMMQRFNVPQSQIDEAWEKALDQSKNPWNLIKGLRWTSIFIVGISALLALFVRKKDKALDVL